MLEDVKKRLEGLGFPLDEKQAWALGFIIDKVVAGILTDCNRTTLPENLKPVAIDMAAGEFLLSAKEAGQLAGFDYEPAVKQWAEGNTSVTLAVGDASLTPEQRLDKLIDSLRGSGKELLACHRRLTW